MDIMVESGNGLIKKIFIFLPMECVEHIHHTSHTSLCVLTHVLTMDACPLLIGNRFSRSIGPRRVILSSRAINTWPLIKEPFYVLK